LIVAAIAPIPGKAGTASPGRSHNLALRIGSALVLAPLALAAAYYDDWPFALFWTLAAVAVLWEWIALVAGAGYRLMFYSGAGAIAVSALVDERGRPITAILVIGLGALAVAIFAPRGKRLWIVAGVGYAGTLLLAPMLLRHDQSQGFAGLGNGFIALLFLFAVVWVTDVLGYFGGRALGGRKLAPAISPGKTWSGAIVGAIGAMAVTAAGAHILGDFKIYVVAALALVLSAAAQLGDLLESRIKRQFGAKDAGHFIPGHGGVMDRLDGFWAAALVACLIGVARGGLEAPARGLLGW